MTFREVKHSLEHPALNDTDLGTFLHNLANLDTMAVHVFNGEVIPEMNELSIRGDAYLLGWKWKRFDLHRLSHRDFNPDPDFIRFVSEAVVRLGIKPYLADDNARAEFEEKFKRRVSFIKSTDGRYAFSAQVGFEAWCSGQNRGKLHGT